MPRSLLYQGPLNTSRCISCQLTLLTAKDRPLARMFADFFASIKRPGDSCARQGLKQPVDLIGQVVHIAEEQLFFLTGKIDNPSPNALMPQG